MQGRRPMRSRRLLKVAGVPADDLIYLAGLLVLSAATYGFFLWVLPESMDFPEEQSGQTDQFATVSQGGFIDTSTDVSRRQADPVAEAEAGGISHPPEPAAAVEAGGKAQTPTAENSPLRGFASLSDTAAPVIRHSNRDWVGAIHVGGDPYSWIGKKIEVLWAPNKKWFYAEVTGYDGTAKKHKIKYLDDGTHEIIALETDEVRLVFGPEWVGRIVELRYEDGAWYQAKIRRFLKDGSHEVEFLQDGSIENVILAKSFMRIPVIPKTTTAVTTVAVPEFGREWDYSAVEIRNDSEPSSEWTDVNVVIYNETEKMHLVRYVERGTFDMLNLAQVAVRIRYDEADVGRGILVYFVGYHEWYAAKIVEYNEGNRSHKLLYTDDNSSEWRRLSQERVSYSYDGSSMGREIMFMDTETGEWSQSWKLIYFDKPRGAHVMIDDEGAVTKQVISQLKVKELHYRDVNSTDRTRYQ